MVLPGMSRTPGFTESLGRVNSRLAEVETAVIRTDPGIAGSVRQALVHDGTDPEWRDRLVVDIRDFDVDPTGANDSTAGIQAAMNEAATFAAPIPVVLEGMNGLSPAIYTITSTITYGTRQELRGQGRLGLGTQIQFDSASLTAHAFAPAVGDHSGIEMSYIHLADMRTDPARTGRGVSVSSVPNGTYLHDMSVHGFYDNYYIGDDSDCVQVVRCWGSEAVRYSLNIYGISNGALVSGFYGDSVASSMDALINVEFCGANAPVEIHSVKHECYQGAHTLRLDQGAAVHASGIAMNSNGGVSGGDVVHIPNQRGNYVVLNAIGTNGAATNLLNIVADGVTIPGTESYLPSWIGYSGYGEGSPTHHGIGKARLMYVQDEDPNGVVDAPLQSIAITPWGAYQKRSAAGSTTGWKRIAVTGPQALDMGAHTTGLTTAGTITGKVALTDLNGNVAGYLPIYDDIT